MQASNEAFEMLASLAVQDGAGLPHLRRGASTERSEEKSSFETVRCAGIAANAQRGFAVDRGTHPC